VVVAEALALSLYFIVSFKFVKHILRNDGISLLKFYLFRRCNHLKATYDMRSEVEIEELLKYSLTLM
jgi:hypothetical protein